MRKFHAALLACTAAALAGCAGGPKAETPAGVTLAGIWKLNHSLSDDPQQVIARMRAQALKMMARSSGGLDEAPRGGPGRRGGAAGTPPPDTNPALTPDEPSPGGGGARRPDPLKYSPMMRVLSDALARGDFLTVRQSSEELVLNYGTVARTFTPGAHSVVSAQMGVADQVSGWKGREYVINIKAQLGPNIVDRFGLSSDGQRLIEKLRIGPAELPAVNLTRVYERTSDTVPRAPPTSD